MFEKVLTERVVVIERGVNKVLKYTESCELFLIGNVAASDPSVFDSFTVMCGRNSRDARAGFLPARVEAARAFTFLTFHARV